MKQSCGPWNAGGNYLEMLRRRNFHTWVMALFAALLINSGLFIIMPMLQTSDCNCRPCFEVVPGVKLVHLKPRIEEQRRQRTPQPKEKEDIIPRKLRPHLPKVAAVLPDPPRIPRQISAALPPVFQQPAALPVDFGPIIRPDSRQIFNAAELDAPLGIEMRVPPLYPLRARERRIEGWVRVRLLVTAEGRVEQAEVEEAQPPGYFEKSVLDCVKKWRLTPPRFAGEPVRAWMTTRIRFKLE